MGGWVNRSTDSSWRMRLVATEVLSDLGRLCLAGVVLVPVPAATAFTRASFSNLISFTMSSYSSRVGSAARSVARLSTVGGPDMIGGSGSSKGGRGLGGSSCIGVAKRSCRIGVLVSDLGDSRLVSSSSSGLTGGVHLTHRPGKNAGLTSER